MVCRQKIKNNDHLKQVMNSYWDMVNQELINGAVDQRPKRLLLVVRSQDGHIEQYFH